MSKTDWPQISVFVSYSRKDMEFADRLSAALEVSEQGNVKILIDRRDLPYGERWWDMLVDFIRRSDRVIFIVSPDSIKSGYCKDELAEIAGAGRRLIPVVVRDTPIADLPPSIRAVQLMPFTDPAAFDVQVAKLVTTLYQNIEWTRDRRFFDTLSTHWSAHGRPRSLLLGADQVGYFKDWQQKRPPNEPILSADADTYFDHSNFFAFREDHYDTLRAKGDEAGSLWMWWGALVVVVAAVALGAGAALHSVIAAYLEGTNGAVAAYGTSMVGGGIIGWFGGRWLLVRQRALLAAVAATEALIGRYGALDEARAFIAAKKKAKSDAAELERLRREAREQKSKAARAPNGQTNANSRGGAQSSPASVPAPAVPDAPASTGSPSWGHQ